MRVKARVFSKWIVVLEMFLSAGPQLGGITFCGLSIPMTSTRPLSKFTLSDIAKS